jgi:hypothetical protein
MSTKTYDPALVVVTLGPYLLSGFAEGTFIKVSRDEDAFTDKTGTDGETARARNKNRAGEVELTFLQTSASNDILSGLAQAGELTGTDVLPLLIKDLLGTTLVSALNAWPKKIADVEEAKEITDRAWTLRCASPLLMNVGGQNPGL